MIFLRVSTFVDYSVWPLDPDILKPKPLTVSACCKLIIQNKIFIRRNENVPDQRARFDKIFIVRNAMNFHHQQRRSSSKPLRASHHTAGEGFLQYLTNKTNSQIQVYANTNKWQIHKCTQTNKLEDCDPTRETILAHWPLSISHINTYTNYTNTFTIQ